MQGAVGASPIHPLMEVLGERGPGRSLVFFLGLWRSLRKERASRVWPSSSGTGESPECPYLTLRGKPRQRDG